MRYREAVLPTELKKSVKSMWSLDCDGDADDWIEHRAIPDGCVELIRRLRGRSIWRTEQPEFFVAGLCEMPGYLKLSGDARFMGIRIWPWVWNMLGETPCPDFRDSWQAIDKGSDARSIMKKPERILTMVETRLGGLEIDHVASYVLHSKSVAELVSLSGASHRQVQRWFLRNIGIPPRRYFRLLRFQTAFAHIQQDTSVLADHAAALGYSDQSHMARDFREFSKSSASDARVKANGPFL